MPLVLKDEEVKQLEALINSTPYASAVNFIQFFQNIGKKRQEEAENQARQQVGENPDQIHPIPAGN